MNEIDEIRRIENAALLDKAIRENYKLQAELIAGKAEMDRQLQRVQNMLGELLAHKIMFGVLKGS